MDTCSLGILLEPFGDVMTSPTAPSSEDKALSVSQLNRQARLLLERVLPTCWVEGEISSLSRPASGHVYFTLKDANAQVRCAMFRQYARFAGGPLIEGAHVQIRAQISLFEPRGDYQLIVEAVRAVGQGALLQALEALKRRLNNEGIFANQRPLPYPPRHLGLITSATGAAIRDVLAVIQARWPELPVSLIPVPVQGQQAPEAIIAAIDNANRDGRFDTLLITRGGGSFEDLNCFNDERLVRAYQASQIPILSAVGHEVDNTLADLAADARAPTPSAAAERLVPDRRDIRRRLVQLAHRLLNAQRHGFDTAHQRLDHLALRLRDPRTRLAEQTDRLAQQRYRLMRAMERKRQEARQRFTLAQQRLNQQPPERQVLRQRDALVGLKARLTRALEWHLKASRHRYNALAQQLDAVSPLATLKRGYAVVRDNDDRLVTQAQTVSPGQTLTVSLNEGRLRVDVRRRLR